VGYRQFNIYLFVSKWCLKKVIHKLSTSLKGNWWITPFSQRVSNGILMWGEVGESGEMGMNVENRTG